MSSHVPEQPGGQKLWQEPNDSERGRPWGLRRAPVTLTRGVTAPWQPSVPLPSSQQGSNLSLASRHYKHSKDIHFLRAAFSRLQVPALGTPCPHNPYKSQGVPFPVQPLVTFFQTPTNAPGTSPTAEPYSPSPLPRLTLEPLGHAMLSSLFLLISSPCWSSGGLLSRHVLPPCILHPSASSGRDGELARG